VADVPQIDPDHPDPNHPEALKRAMHAIVGHSVQLLPFRAGNSLFKLTFSAEQRTNVAAGEPVRGMLWRVRHGSNDRQLVGMLDVNLLASERGRVLDITVDLPYQAALIPSLSEGERLTASELVEFDEYKQFAHEFDASLRRSIAQRCADWRRLVDATRCTVRSDDVYLPHYLRESGYQFVFDVVQRPDSGRVPFVAATYKGFSSDGPPAMGRALRSALIRQEVMRLVVSPDTSIKVSSLRGFFRGDKSHPVVGFETLHVVRDDRQPKRVQWSFVDRRYDIGSGVPYAVSADLVVTAVRAVDRAARTLGASAMPSSVVFARPRNVATDVLSHNWDATHGRNWVDGKLSVRNPSVFILDERLVRLPDALVTQKGFVHEVRDGVRLSSGALPVEETVAMLAWRRMLTGARPNAVAHRQRLRAAVEALIGGRGIELLDRPFDLNETLRDVQHRAAMVNEIGSHRALRSVDAFGTQMFANWFNNPLATPQADHVMSAMQLDQYRPELTL
jgi:hypothetical protein